MQRLYTLTLAMFIIAMMSLSLAPVMAQEDGLVYGSVVINDGDDDPWYPFIYGDAWIGNFREYRPNKDTLVLVCNHKVYAHHYSTELKVNYSMTTKLLVNENPNYMYTRKYSGTMDRYDPIRYAMPQNGINPERLSYLDVSRLPRLPGNKSYTAAGYTRLYIPNHGGDDLNLKSEGKWKFWR